MRQRSKGRVTLAGAAAVCAVAALPAVPAQAAGQPKPYAYGFDADAQVIKGAESTADAEALTEDTTYRSSIGPEGKLNFRVDLDAKKNAYVSVVAAPRLEAKLEYSDGIKVTLQDSQGRTCSDATATVGSGSFAQPLAAYAHRTIEKDGSSCQEAGAYNVLVERTSAEASTPGDWALEIRHVTEPGLKEAGPTEAPTQWPSASPGLPGGGTKKAAGGTSFNDAAEISEGEWNSPMEAGRTYFFRVKVDWGQRFFGTASLGSTNTEGYAFVSQGLTMRLYNPLRGLVEDAYTTYDGKQKQAALDPVPPVAYENRFGSGDDVQGMRLGGEYYLAVSLNPELADKFGKKPFGVTLRVNVEGDAKAAPPYTEPLGDLGVSEGEKAEKSDTMKLVGTAGVGAGTVLVLGLGAWTLLARRRAVPGPAAGQGQAGPGDGTTPTPYGPPASW
ncbi:hypothetical protein OHA27_17210 [Streptomyces sp. NBC_01619]|uniref:hypothetical protein n=1 Tax=Streptomyces sp. NBC_01619 TaxID=2975901 RepID=UPI0022546590|nr:hypothetical protein [Streptomyces sp. NBC_01619]MCX4512010.1 hypothetical protein [Streptomyces sp. NBC_01619]